MGRTCIHTLEPIEGGVPAKVREIVDLHTRAGHDVKLLYTATEQVPLGRVAMARYFLRARPQWEERQGYSAFAIPAWPLPLWTSYAIPLLAARSVIEHSDMHVIVSGSNHCGLPVALLRKKYLIWIGTLYEEELSGKAAAGDEWAQRVLKGPGLALLRWEERIIFERAALILTNGAHTAEMVRRTYPSVSDRVRVVIYPIDTNVFRPDPSVRRSVSTPYLLFTARINDPRKNLPMLFHAFARVHANRPDLRLVLTGGQPGDSIRRAVRNAGVEDAVQFVGRQTRKALVELYQGAELFVLPSLQEGLCISMLEALACGLPVVSTRCGGPESVIRDGETGLLVENGNPDAMAEAILQLLARPADVDSMRICSVNAAREMFAKDRIWRQLQDAFREIYPEYFGHVSSL